MKTRDEIRKYLDSQIDKKPICKNNRALDGQCVTLIKNLLDFLGEPSAWKARGNAKDYGNGLIKDGIADKDGRDDWLRVCVSSKLGGGYGHVWIDLLGETNYESNGAKRLRVSKGTRSYNQATQVVGLDKYVSINTQNENNSETAHSTEQHGTFRASVNRNIRRSPSLSGEIAGTFTAGASQKYDSYVDSDGFRWVSWIGGSGHRNYVAVRRLSDNKRYGVCF